MTRARLAAVHLAIVAMLLRALLPAGWMPDPTGTAAFTICTMDATGHHAEQDPAGKPVPEDSRHVHEECPFAAAPHVAAPVLVAHLAAPSRTARTIDFPELLIGFGPVTEYGPHSPRAPPHIA
jgi:hypothetical protein